MGDIAETLADTVAGETPRQRLLDVAERLFAERGFTAIHVREITDAAGCNVASVNYYFGTKDKLYQQVLLRRLRSNRDRRIRAIDSAMQTPNGCSTLEGLLRKYASATLGKPPEQSRWDDLLWRELFDPRFPPRVLVDEVIRPVEEALVRALRRFEPRLSEKHARNCARSVVGQLGYLIHLNRFLCKEEGCQQDMLSSPQGIDHIVNFSAAGIRAYGNRGKRGAIRAVSS